MLNINSLYKKYRNGDKQAEKLLFETLLVRFRLFANLRINDREDSEELVQNSLLVVFEESKDMQFRTSFSSWAYQVLRNRIMTYNKTKKRRKLKFISNAHDKSTDAYALDIDPEFRLRFLECLKKIGQTNINYARILNLVYQGFSTSEISAKLKIKANNLYVILHRSRSLMDLCLHKGVISE